MRKLAVTPLGLLYDPIVERWTQENVVRGSVVVERWSAREEVLR